MVTGGTGYIGAHTVQLLLARGDDVVVVDDLLHGQPDRVSGVPLTRLDLASDEARHVLGEVLRDNGVEAVMHFAGRKRVGESVVQPAKYYRDNLGGLAQLLLAMEDAAVNRLVFSSSAAVYGGTVGSIAEDAECSPLSPYGETKLWGERLISAASVSWGLRAASLRYFNVGGASTRELADSGAFNLIPIVFDHIEQGRAPIIFGDDYETLDGTCVRDYVHVSDVAEAHLAVLDALPLDARNEVFNIGTGVGTSVREMMAVIERVTGVKATPVVAPRRPGDPDAAVAVVERIAQAKGWRARFGLEEIVTSAWEARFR